MARRMTRPLLLVLALALAVTGQASADADAALAERVRAAIEATPELAASKATVSAAVEGGAMHLRGTVRLYREKLLVERVARSAAGTAPITYDVHVVPLMPAGDREIERLIIGVAKLTRFQGSDLRVDVDAGEVVVRGVFHDPADVVFLTEEIAAIEGVRSIEIDARFPV